MEPSGNRPGHLPFPGLSGGLRLDGLADADADLDPTPAVAHFRSTMASMGYAVTLRLDSASSPTTPDDAGRRPWSPIVTPTPPAGAAQWPPFGSAPRPPPLGGGRGPPGGPTGAVAGGGRGKDTTALSSPVSGSTPRRPTGGVLPPRFSALYSPPPSPSSTLAVRSAGAASAGAAATAAAEGRGSGSGWWQEDPSGRTPLALSSLPPIPPLGVPALPPSADATAAGHRGVPAHTPPRLCPRHPLLDASADRERRPASGLAPKRSYATLMRGVEGAAGWRSAPHPLARQGGGGERVLLAPLRPPGDGPPGRGGTAAATRPAPLPPPPLPPPPPLSPPPRTFWGSVIVPPPGALPFSPPLGGGGATVGAGGVPPPPGPSSLLPPPPSRALPFPGAPPPVLPLAPPPAASSGTAAAAIAARAFITSAGSGTASVDGTAVTAGDGAGAAITPRPFVCDECGSTHSRAGNLAKHVRLVHGRRRPHACAECGACFGQRSNLSAHARAVHRRLRPHACAECDASFAQKSALVAHVSAVHRRLRPYACPECGYVHVVGGEGLAMGWRRWGREHGWGRHCPVGAVLLTGHSGSKDEGGFCCRLLGALWPLRCLTCIFYCVLLSPVMVVLCVRLLWRVRCTGSLLAKHRTGIATYE